VGGQRGGAHQRNLLSLSRFTGLKVQDLPPNREQVQQRRQNR
jgi:hypothetical protein